MNTTVDIRVRPLEEGDSRDVAAIHKHVFDDAPSSRLGGGYCRKLYELYATERDAFGYVLLQDGEVVGFVVGGETDTHERISRKLRKQALLASVVRPSLLLVWTLKEISKRSKRKPGMNGSAGSAKAMDKKRTSKLFLIGIIEKARGTGGARELLGSFIDHAFSREFDSVVLTVHRNNARARAAYEKAGWVLNDRGGESVEYYMVRSK